MEWIYLIGLGIMSVVRKLFTSPKAVRGAKATFPSGWDTFWLIVVGFGMLAPLVSIYSDWLSFAVRPSPHWTWVAGAVLTLLAAWMLLRSHVDLGYHWHPSLGIQKHHSLVEIGIYRYLRHPMYAAHLVWGLALLILIPNWITGPWLLVSTIGLLIHRIPREEQMLLKELGAEYAAYQRRVGGLIPRLW